MLNTISPLLDPDPVTMRRLLEHVFHSDLDGAHNALAELAWQDTHTGTLSAAQLFRTDEIDDLVGRADKLNRTPNCNVYVGAASRKLGIAKLRRGADADFHEASCILADVDNDVVASAVATCKDRGVLPTMTVVTGRHPHVRAQMWWRLGVPCRDPAALRPLCSNITQAVGGDPSVVNPGHVLRLGGSIAWPTKTGRGLERTEVHIPDDNRQKQYLFEQLIHAFTLKPGPLVAPAAPAPEKIAPQSSLQIRDQLPSNYPHNSGGECARLASAPHSESVLAIGSMSVDDTPTTIRRGEHWHNHVVRLVGHWTVRGWSDTEILATAAATLLT